MGLQPLGSSFPSYDTHIQLALPAHYSRAAPFDNVNFAEAHNRPVRSAAPVFTAMHSHTESRLLDSHAFES
jgi:hypothetical protein